VRSAIKAWILCQHAAERVDIFGRLVIVSIGGRRLALTEETIQFPQGSRQRRKRAGGPLQLARMRGRRSDLRDPFAWPNARLRAGAAARRPGSEVRRRVSCGRMRAFASRAA